VFFIMAAALILAWGISVLVDEPWFRRFLALVGLMGGK
jgi:hypothetical protein